MRSRFMRLLAVLNVLLAIGLVVVAMWLYGREHEARRLERQIRKLEQAQRLEEEAIRRLAIEWQALRNPVRLEKLARLKLNLAPPDPAAVRPFLALMENLPMRPAAQASVAAERDALATMAQRAAGEGAPATAPEEATAPQSATPAGPLTGTIRQTAPEAKR